MFVEGRVMGPLLLYGTKGAVVQESFGTAVLEGSPAFLF
jgi:hypothetical protein